MNRRNFLKTALLGGTGVGIYSLGCEGTTYALEVTHSHVTIPHLPPAFEGYRIGFLSDIHIGECTDAAFVLSAVELLNAQKPDILLLGGDYILHTDSRMTQAVLSTITASNCFRSNEESAERFFSQLAGILSICNAPDGAFAVLGNHDRSSGGRLCARTFGNQKIHVLINEAQTIRRGDDELEIVGYDDLWTGVPRAFPLRSREGTAKRHARVVLSHNPDLFDQIITRWKVPFDLGLAGHTHGGQIKLPGIGALSYNVRDLRFAEGLVELLNIHLSRAWNSGAAPACKLPSRSGAH
jgi:predicted MPP superfamily phosphohydrolase